MPRKEKRSESLEVRLGFSAKREFMDACRERGLTASEVVRDFVEAYPARRSGVWSLSNLRLPEQTMTYAFAALLSAGLLAAAMLPTSNATADREDPRAAFARIDKDNDGHFELDDFFSEAGLSADGHLTDQMRDEIVQSIQRSLSETGGVFQEVVLNPSYIEEVLASAEESARDSVHAVFDEIDTNGDMLISRAEYLAFADRFEDDYERD